MCAFIRNLKEKFQDVTTTNCPHNNHRNIAFIGAHHQYRLLVNTTRNFETLAIRKYHFLPFHFQSRPIFPINVFVFVFVSGRCVSESQILGIICVVLVTINFNEHGRTPWTELFFYLMVTTFLICTTILLVSCLFSWSTGGIISKTIYVSNRRQIPMQILVRPNF